MALLITIIQRYQDDVRLTQISIQTFISGQVAAPPLPALCLPLLEPRHATRLFGGKGRGKVKAIGADAQNS